MSSPRIASPVVHTPPQNQGYAFCSKRTFAIITVALSSLAIIAAIFALANMYGASAGFLQYFSVIPAPVAYTLAPLGIIGITISIAILYNDPATQVVSDHPTSTSELPARNRRSIVSETRLESNRSSVALSETSESEPSQSVTPMTPVTPTQAIDVDPAIRASLEKILETEPYALWDIHEQIQKGDTEIIPSPCPKTLQLFEDANLLDEEGRIRQEVFETLSNIYEFRMNDYSVTEKGVRLPHSTPQSFSEIRSGRLVSIDSILTSRHKFLEASKDEQWQTPPPRIAASSFVPMKTLSYLMRMKMRQALAIKFREGTAITNMEGVFATFITPICKIHMVGDDGYSGAHVIHKHASGMARQVVLSAAVQPDFETDDVMLQLVQPRSEACEGSDLFRTGFQIPTVYEKAYSVDRLDYDEKLRKHLVYHLTADHRLPSFEEVDSSMNANEAIEHLERLLTSESMTPEIFKDQFVSIVFRESLHAFSLEILFNTYVHQLRNEFVMLEQLLPQGYVYTIDPPAIFATLLGDANLLNRFQALAFRYLHQSEFRFDHLKLLAFNDYNDPGMIPLLMAIFDENVRVVSKAMLYQGEEGHYSGPEDFALVIHNNSDGFGQNIEFEGNERLNWAGSKDGIIGAWSDAACVLKRQRPDLLSDAYHIHSDGTTEHLTF